VLSWVSVDTPIQIMALIGVAFVLFPISINSCLMMACGTLTRPAPYALATALAVGIACCTFKRIYLKGR
jgi:hypothetical protein